MELNDWLIVLVVQAGVLLVILWFLRFSNKKLVKEIGEIEKNLKKLNEFIDKLTASQKRMRSELKNEPMENTPVKPVPAPDERSPVAVAVAAGHNRKK